MGLLNRIITGVRNAGSIDARRDNTQPGDARREAVNTEAQDRKRELLRRCQFEIMEERRVLSANPVIAGATYLEGDLGQDTTPDYFEVTFQGGADTTQMTQFTINGDQDLNGVRSDGDMFFDENSAPPGTGGSHAFQFNAEGSSGVSASDIVSATVSSDGLLLSVEVNNFEAGDVLAFTIDVDEVEGIRNDKIASGIEFESTQFNAVFVDENYTFEDLNVSVDTIVDETFPQTQVEGLFYDSYDAVQLEGGSVAGQELLLALDNELGQSDRSAGAIDAYELVAKPVTISGTVYHDEDLDCEHDAGEDGIAGVDISLQLLNEQTGSYGQVAATTTDAAGNYEFGVDLNLMPGEYRLVETQPDGYLDVGASAGTVEGTQTGDVSKDSSDNANIISSINIPLGGTAATDYDFKEVRPASIAGNVWHDENNDGVFDPNEQGIANVLIQVTRVGAKDGVTSDPFVDSAPIFVRTDSNGHYNVDALPPGIYEIVEINNYPSGEDPLAAYVDGKDSVGNIRGETVGAKSNDRFSTVTLCADDHGEEYNFGELKPASISGHVSVATPDGDCYDPTDPDYIGIEGVSIELYDQEGNLVDTAATDANGFYEFGDLVPGVYTIVEVQPGGYLDANDSVGSVDGTIEGVRLANDRFQQISISSGDEGVNYDFCEHIPASISGQVHADSNGDCVFDPSEGDKPIEGVALVLLDADGNEVGRTVTDSQGMYSFDDLPPGEYSVREVQPDGYLDGAEMAGTVHGESIGETTNDLISGITLTSGAAAVNYDFCEHIPATLKGTVYHDINNNGRQDSGEEGIEDVRIVLTDANGVVVSETLTDADGNYCFEDLVAGTYKVQEFQPDGFVDGKDQTGTIDGRSVGEKENDLFCEVTIRGGDEAIDYDFGEIKLASISGVVHVDANGDCVYDPGQGERLLANVTIELLDANGNVVETTTTDSNGAYEFTNVLPGEYSIREQQPEGFFEGGQKTGSHSGNDSVENLISGITVDSGQKLTRYNFCEVEHAEIHGQVWEDGPAFETEDGNVPDNYRDQRDGVYQAGVDTPIAGVRMQLYYFVDPTNQEISPRPVTLGEVHAEDYAHMGTSDPNAPVWVETMANGEYWFTGLQAGNYIVLETQPDGYVDANDIAGSTTGLTYNSSSEASVAIFSGGLGTFTADQVMDSVTNIRVNAGGISVANNFTEVRVETLPTDTPPDPTTPTRVPPGGNPQTPRPGLTGPPGLAGAQNGSYSTVVGTSSGINITGRQAARAPDPYSWHLSVVNGGNPRAAGEGLVGGTDWMQVGFLNNTDWSRYDMQAAEWTFTESSENGGYEVTDRHIEFGMLGGTPLAGDFDGDGYDEVAVFKDGYWMIDINRNGQWEDSDLLAKLGDVDDRPVVGDWDGDGKDDIGIYGPMWQRDPEAIEREPGLPNPENYPDTQPKNVPPVDDDATNGARIMKLTSYGKQRADVVDHVFGTGEREDVPVTGDWNGNGIRSIGIFNHGLWKLDVNGDGEFDHHDESVRFGRGGDVPLVGDFNGDGIEQIAVYRSGTWIIDSNGNRELEATDRTFDLGAASDKPVVGDWDGDGKDEPGLYSERSDNAS